MGQNPQIEMLQNDGFQILADPKLNEAKINTSNKHDPPGLNALSPESVEKVTRDDYCLKTLDKLCLDLTFLHHYPVFKGVYI